MNKTLLLLIALNLLPANIGQSNDTRRSCHDLYVHRGLISSGRQFITPTRIQDANKSVDGFWVYCDVNETRSGQEVLTIVHHDSEDPVSVQGKESPGSYSRDVNYNGTDEDQLTSLIDGSTFCYQYIKWACKGSSFAFWFPADTDSWWVGRGWKNQYYWGGAETDSQTCSCHPYCLPRTSRNSTCNCDANYKLKWIFDHGLLIDKSRLPVLQLRFGDTGESNEAGQHTLGPLVCSSAVHKDVYLGTYVPPATISSPGYPSHYPDPFRRYHWNFTIPEGVNGTTYYELVFHDYDVVHWPSYNSIEQCVDAMIVRVYDKENNVVEIRRKARMQPYYVTDDTTSHISLTLTTCHQMDEDRRHSGFRASVKKTDCGSCSGKTYMTIDGQSYTECKQNCGVIASINYPFPFDTRDLPAKFHQQKWFIEAPINHGMKLTFEDFDVVSSLGGRNCSSNHGGSVLHIYDGPTNNLSDLIGSFCNINKPSTIISSGRFLLLIYTAHFWEVGNGRGFHATYHVTHPNVKVSSTYPNVAKGKPTMQISTEDARQSFFAVDGILHTCTSTLYQKEPWWRVDLHKMHNIHSVYIIGKPKPVTVMKELLWPDGQYGLPMPVSGCPASKVFKWKEGRRLHAINYGILKDDKMQFWSDGIMLKGGLQIGVGAVKNFCIKNENADEIGEYFAGSGKLWPQGVYCIYQVTSKCPAGFDSGYINFIDRQSNFNGKNSAAGILPFGNYTKHTTKYYFCCRRDGNPDISIKLPTKMPFYLLQYGKTCQKVEGMSLLSQYFHFNTNNKEFSADFGTYFKKPHPEVISGLYDKGLTLNYCYYDIADSLRGVEVLIDSSGLIQTKSRYYDHKNFFIPHVSSENFQLAYICGQYLTNHVEDNNIRLECQRGTRGQFVTLFLKNRHDKMELCEVEIYAEEECGQPLGLTSGEIFNSQLTSSSADHKSGYKVEMSRLNTLNGGWCAAVADPQKYLQVDLKELTIISGVILQGVEKHGENVYASKFTLGFSVDGVTWSFEEEPVGQQKVYKCVQCELHKESGIDFSNMQFHYNLLTNFDARYIRLKILSYVEQPCLRLEIVGCRNQSDCRYEFTEHNGTITTPNYPYYYGQDKSCWWIINVPSLANHIWLEFNILDLADAEDSKQSGSCHDTLTVYHQRTSFNLSLQSSTVGSSTLMPKLIISDGSIRIHLRTCFRSSITHAQGFLASYHLTDCPGCGNLDIEHKHLCTSSCGYIYTSGYPLQYPKGLRDRWKIIVAASHYIEIKVVEFDVANCDTDYLDIYDGHFDVKYHIGRYTSCNKPPHQLVSSFNQLLLEFSADSVSHGRGLLVKYLSKKFEISPELQNKIEMGNESSGCSDKWLGYDHNCYALFRNNEPLTWYDAESACKSNVSGSHLVSILDTNEMTILQYIMNTIWNVSSTRLYIGLTDKGKEGVYTWTDGNPMSYADWSYKHSQPDGGQFEDCSIFWLDSLHSTNHWNDIPCSLGAQHNLSSGKQNLPTVSDYICKSPAFLEGKDINRTYKQPVMTNHINSNSSQDEIQSFSSRHYYKCDNDEFISVYFVCDGFEDCKDASDENYCGGEELSMLSYFSCEDGQRIPIGFVCDFKEDCSDNSDETFCVHPKCKSDEIMCNNRQCIKLNKKCDLIVDCIDGTDEQNCSGKCDKHSTFQCNYGTCIPKYAFMDGYKDCPGIYGEDEPVILANNDECKTKFPDSCVRESVKSSVTELGRSSYHYIQPFTVKGDSTTMPFIVECLQHPSNDFEDSEIIIVESGYEFDSDPVAVVHHDSEHKLFVPTPAVYSYERSLTYSLASIRQIRSLIGYSSYCYQSIQWEEIPTVNTEAVTADYIITLCFYGNGVLELQPGDQFCDDPTVSCTSSDNATSDVNCNVVDRHVLSRSGFFIFVNVTDLPITQIRVKNEVLGKFLSGYHTISPVYCRGSKNLVINPSCKDTDLSIICQNGHKVSSSHRCIYEFDVYGYQTGCRDVTHLRNCDNSTCKEGYVKCPQSYCIPISYVCNGNVDCPAKADEFNCDNYRCSGKYRCHRQQNCVTQYQLCDGISDCLHRDDELLCDFTCPYNCTCIGLNVDCSFKALNMLQFVGLNQVRKLNVSVNRINERGLHFDDPSYLLELDLSHNHLKIVLPTTFTGLRNLQKLNLRHNRIVLLERNSFHSLTNLKTLLLEGNIELNVIKPGAFVGISRLTSLNLTDMNIKLLQSGSFIGLKSLKQLSLRSSNLVVVEDEAFDGLVQLTHLNIEDNRIEYFSSRMFDDLTSLDYLSSDSFQFCCVASGNIPFSHCTPSADEISSCEDLMRNVVQRVFLWILGSIAFVGNLFVIIWRLKIKDANRLSASLIISLGCSDFIMGLYLIIIACVDVYYRGHYIEYSARWKRSVLCKVCGFLSTVSTEVSVFTLTLITLDRLICLSFPMTVRRWSVSFTRMLIATCWVISFVLATIPFMVSDYFSGQFYSRSGVCLALHMTNQKPAGWEYSVALFFGVNFCAFVTIMLSYVHMYWAIKKSCKATNSMAARKSAEFRVGKQMSLIVLSNFCCWMPIIIIGFLALSGVKIPGAIYSWTAVFILPLNSAVNPVLYTLSSVQFKTSVEKWICSCFFKDSAVTSSYHMSRKFSQNINFKDYGQLQKNQNGYFGKNLVRSHQPPPGYCTLLHYLRKNGGQSNVSEHTASLSKNVSLVDIMHIAIRICTILKELHCNGYALGGLDMELVFISENQINENRIQVYVPDINAYKTCSSLANEHTDDTAKDIEDYGNLIRKMLRVYHLHWKKESI